MLILLDLLVLSGNHGFQVGFLIFVKLVFEVGCLVQLLLQYLHLLHCLYVGFLCFFDLLAQHVILREEGIDLIFVVRLCLLLHPQFFSQFRNLGIISLSYQSNSIIGLVLVLLIFLSEHLLHSFIFIQQIMVFFVKQVEAMLSIL